LKSKAQIHAVDSLALPSVIEGHLSNGIPYAFVPAPYPGPCKIELNFLAGRPQESERLSAYAANSLLSERTTRYTGPQIAQRIDYYGASLQPSASFDIGTLQLLGTERHLDRLVPLLIHCAREAVFREEDLQLFTDSHIQDLSVDLEQTDAVSYRVLTALLFGEDHPYGYNSTAELYRALTTSSLKHFHRDFYLNRAPQILIMGSDLRKILKRLEQHTEGWPFLPWDAEIPPLPQAFESEVIQSVSGKSQTSIKIGRIWPGIHHQDHPGLLILNTLVGGYFGSRLVQQIREKKGYTYNIYSAYDNYRFASFFYIGCESSHRKAGLAKAQIHQELDRLKHELVPDSELRMIKNYLAGQLSSQLDNALMVSDWLRQSLTEGSDWRGTSHLLEQLLSITPRDIQDLAQQYLDTKTLTSVIVG